MPYLTARDAYYGEIISREFIRARDCSFCSVEVIFGDAEDITVKLKPYQYISDPPVGGIYYAQATSDDDGFYFHNIDNESDIVKFPIPDDYLIDPADLAEGCVTVAQCETLIKCNQPSWFPSDSVQASYAAIRAGFDKSKSREIPYAELLQHMYAHQKRLLAEGKIWAPLPCGKPTSYGYYSNPDEMPTLGECTEQFAKFQAEHGLFDDCVEHVYYIDPARVKAISDIAEAIMEEYDSEPVEVAAPGEPQTSWEKFGLGSDDDVDYNGGYVTHTIDLLLDFINTRSAYENETVRG